MNRVARLCLSMTILLAACTETPVSQQARTHAPVGNAQGYAEDGQDCNARAQSRVSLYDRPGAYPLSDKERSDAYNALFSECMKEHSWQVARTIPPASNGSDLAALSPSAGKPSAPVSPYPPGVIVIDTAHLNDPANAAGKTPNGYPGATVVVVQAQQPNVAAAAPAAIPQQPTIIGGPARSASQQPVIIGSAPHTPQPTTVIGGPRPPEPQPSASELASYSPAAGSTAPAATPSQPPSSELERILTKTD